MKTDIYYVFIFWVRPRQTGKTEKCKLVIPAARESDNHSAQLFLFKKQIARYREIRAKGEKKNHSFFGRIEANIKERLRRESLEGTGVRAMDRKQCVNRKDG